MSAPAIGTTKLIGAPIKRREDPRFLTGQTHYVDDVKLPRMVYAAFVRSPHAHADIKGFRTDRARAVPGVVAVMTSDETSQLARPIRCDSLLPGFKGTDNPILAWPRVRFAGEAVAIVIATDRYTAEDAAELVEVDYEPLPAVYDCQKAVEPGSPLVWPEWGDNYFIDRSKTFGDVEGAFKAAEFVWKRTYKIHRHTAFPMEYRAYVADYQAASAELTVYASTQLPHLVRTAIADAVGMPEHSVRVIAPDVGGGFGIKAVLLPEDVAVCVASRRLGRPVKWIEDCREHLMAAGHAREQVHHVEIAARRDGTILGIKADVIADAGAYSCWPNTAAMDAGMAAGLIPGPYAVPAYEMRARSVVTNKCPQSSYRGVGRPPAAFTIERAIEDLARELRLDPIEIRRRNYVPDDAYPYTNVTGLTFDSGSLVASLDVVAKGVDYERFRTEQAQALTEGRYIGIGFGSFIEQTAHTTREFIKRGSPINYGYDTVSVALDASGKIVVDSSLHSHGQGHETVFAQIVAERLGVPIEDVNVRFGDTRSAPYGMGTLASRSAVLGGGAAWRAADNVRGVLLKIAANIMEASADDLEIKDAVISVRGTQMSMTVAQVARMAFQRPEKLPDGVLPAELTSIQSYDAPPGSGTWTNSIHAAVVEVDVRTGFVKILRYVVAEDCGNMINPLIVDGQVHGGTVQGIGGAMLEHLVYDEQGAMLSQTLMDYLIPTALDVPNIEVHHLCTPSPFTVGGFKGMGEGGAIGPLPALANAVSDALAPLGVSIAELPLSPERVLAHVNEARR